MRAVFQWNLGSRTVELGKRTLIMGIVNVTPDSFSDGGLYFDSSKAIAHALELLDEGADIIDIGGESTRPGARVASASPPSSSSEKTVVSAEEELRRVLPVIAELKKLRPAAIISIDTYKATVARAAIQAGAEIVNDVSALRWDPQMVRTIIADYTTGLTAAQAITAALFGRQRSGEGQHVRISMLDAMISYLWPEAMPSLTFVGEERDPSDGEMGPDLVFATQDRYITAAALSDDEWAGMCRALKRRPFTSTVCASTKRAAPRTYATPLAARLRS